ncbi:MAG: hypothetical protein P0120_07770 [Nitrospira sp.]|nr:hypothetical protein [Nitrospira sp.]
MAKNALALVRNGSKPKVEPSAPHQFRECPISEEWLFQGTDEVGREGWFLRLTISGLYPRRVGPFSSQEEALELLEDFLYEVTLGPLLDEVENKMRNPQVCVAEGIPRLTATVEGTRATR